MKSPRFLNNRLCNPIFIDHSFLVYNNRKLSPTGLLQYNPEVPIFQTGNTGFLELVAGSNGA
jgi:hypothetical protein